MTSDVWGVSIAVIQEALQALGVLGVLLMAVAQLCLWRRPRRGSPRVVQPSVTILKPLCGTDGDLSENLQGFGSQDYPTCEVIFGASDPADPALAVAREFARAHPELRTKVTVGEARQIANPKVALLQHMQQAAEGDWLVISDSNVRVPSTYLQDALRHAGDPRVGLITHRIVGAGGNSWAARCENVHLNCFVAPIASAAQVLLGHTCVIGKSIFLRRDVLTKLGGLERVGSFLAEDYMLGQLVERLGFEVVTSEAPITAWHAGWSFDKFLRRHARWAVMRRRISITAYAVEGLLSGAVWLLLTLPVLSITAATATDWSLVTGSLVFKYAMDAVSYKKLSGRPMDWKTLVAAPLRDVCVFAIWMYGWFAQVVEWRGKLYHVQAKTRVAPVAALGMQEFSDEY